MKKYLAPAAAAVGIAMFSPNASAKESCAELRPSVRAMLDAYSAKDIDSAMRFMEGGNVLIMGTDRTELADNAEKVRALLGDDFALWGSSRFGEFSFVSCRQSRDMATMAFDVPFTMQRSPDKSDIVLIRFLTVWTKRGGKWLLTQSLNSVPTEGQSAKEILKRASGGK